MHDDPGLLPIEALSPGTHLLGTSPPMLGLRQVGYEFVARGLSAVDAGVVVTTDRGARRVTDAIDELAVAPELDRLGIVDASGQEPPLDLSARTESAGSPADLTGIAIGLTKLLDGVSGAEHGIRVLVDSVSTLLVYSGFQRLYKFLHSMTHRIEDVGGSSLSTLSRDIDEEGIRRLEELFDGVLAIRDADPTPEYRLKGLGETGDWQQLVATQSRQSGSPGEARAGGELIPESATALERPTSLREAIQAVESVGLTLTLVNRSNGPDRLADLRTYFDRLNVDVREAALSTETPANMAILHRGSDVIATSAVSDLHTAIDPAALDSADSQSIVQPDVLEHVHRNEFTVADGSKLAMVRISRLIETRGLEAGFGTLHAGFQELDRIDDEFETRDLYERIARVESMCTSTVAKEPSRTRTCTRSIRQWTAS